MKAFITSQFSYCPLAWMFHSKNLSEKLNALHEMVLRIIYGDKSSSFNEMFQKDNSVSIHHKNVQPLVTEMYKVSNDMSPTILEDIFASTSYNSDGFKMEKVCVVYKDTETLSHLVPKMGA